MPGACILTTIDSIEQANKNQSIINFNESKSIYLYHFIYSILQTGANKTNYCLLLYYDPFFFIYVSFFFNPLASSLLLVYLSYNSFKDLSYFNSSWETVTTSISKYLTLCSDHELIKALLFFSAICNSLTIMLCSFSYSFLLSYALASTCIYADFISSKVLCDSLTYSFT